MNTKLDTYQEQILLEDSKSKTFKFYLSSAIMHLSLLASSLLIGELMPLPEKKDLVEINIQTETPDVASAPTESQQATAPDLGKSQAQMENKSEEVVTVKSKAVTKPSFKAPAVVAAKEVKQNAEEAIETSSPASEAPQVSQIAQATSGIQEEDLDETFDQVDQEHSKQLAQLKNEMDESSQHLLAEQEKDLNVLKEKEAARSEALAKHLAKMKSEDEQKIKSVLASELAAKRAAEEKAAAARAAAKKDAESKAAAARAQAAAEKARAEKLAKEVALGNSLGVDVPVKALEDLKQMPGNSRPYYDNEDRLATRQGEISFLAYVELDGRISKFKLLKSTGHRSLDTKTYAAIKTWKFYPGQEGWVEIPFKWDLKGGAQEMPATLRRSVSKK